ncbi:MAG: hypothetical protein ABWZ30_00935 [Jiangellaceae bacterium]
MTEAEARQEAGRRNDAETDPAFFHIATESRGVWRVRRWARTSVRVTRLGTEPGR